MLGGGRWEMGARYKGCGSLRTSCLLMRARECFARECWLEASVSPVMCDMLSGGFASEMLGNFVVGKGRARP